MEYKFHTFLQIVVLSRLSVVYTHPICDFFVAKLRWFLALLNLRQYWILITNFHFHGANVFHNITLFIYYFIFILQLLFFMHILQWNNPGKTSFSNPNPLKININITCHPITRLAHGIWFSFWSTRNLLSIPFYLIFVRDDESFTQKLTFLL